MARARGVTYEGASENRAPLLRNSPATGDRKDRPIKLRPGIAPGPCFFWTFPLPVLFGRFGLARGQFRSVFGAFDRELFVAFGRELLIAPQLTARARRDETAHDDVFLQTLQRVRLAVGSSFGEHARGLLERRGRDERTRLQARLGDAEQHGLGG